MHSPGVRRRLEVLRSVTIGRLRVEVVQTERILTCSRTRIASVNDPSYMLLVPLQAPLDFEQEGRTGTVLPWQYLLLSQNAFYELSTEAGRELMLIRLPAADIKGRLVSVDDHIGRRFEPDRRTEQFLVEFLESATRLFADTEPPNPEAFATQILGMIGLALSTEDRSAVTDVRNSRYRLRRRIVQYIDMHLDDHDLSPRKIAKSNRISLSYLYSLLNDDDVTVTEIIRVKRLQRAYEILVADSRGHRTVSEIAYEVGFKNVSHFSRSFSSHFGFPPRDAHNRSGDERFVPIKQSVDGAGALVMS